MKELLDIDETTASALIREIQDDLQKIGLYDGQVDGIFGKYTEAALLQFSNVLSLDSNLDDQSQQVKDKLLGLPEVVGELLQINGQGDRLFQKFWNEQQLLTNMGQVSDAHLGFLDRGAKGTPAGTVHDLPNRNFAPSPFLAQASQFTQRLAQQPDGVHVTAYKEIETIADSAVRVRFRPFPNIGVLPPIEEVGLEFLHPDITEACVTTATIIKGQLLTRWIGRNALRNAQFWSTTKIIPLLYTIAAANRKSPTLPINQCWVTDKARSMAYNFGDLASRICTYEEMNGMTSNALAAMFKQFTSPQDLEKWLKSVTGNQQLVFQGRYGEAPFLPLPYLMGGANHALVLESSTQAHRGDNLISAYDLTRVITQMAWHRHLAPSQRIPAVQWHSLSTLIEAMSLDTARYFDAAFSALGLEKFISQPVVLSKMGFGYSDQRQRTELTYSAYVQFIDHLQPVPKWRSVCITLRAAKDLKQPKREALEIDARVAAEVTKILRYLVTEELI
ncbi:MAG: peptidoglycan-binding domain-containing protein [Pseudanabaena sp. ELA607]